MRRPVARGLVAVALNAASLPLLPAPAGAAGAIAYAPTADAYVASDKPTTKYGSASELRVGASPVYRSYLRFEVQGAPAPVHRAVLRLLARSASSIGVEARAVSSNNWKEATITYKNAPAASATALGSSGPFAAGTWVEVDVTDLITRDGVYSLALTSSGNGMSFASRETGSTAPQLVVEPLPESPSPTTVPETEIVAGPGGTNRSGAAVFNFSSDQDAVTFECSLDAAGFTPCGSSSTFHVANGRHQLAVRSRNELGADLTPATATWWADALLQNGNFETPVTGWSAQNYEVAGWKGYRASPSSVPGGVAGPVAGRAAFSGGGSDYSIYSSPKPVNATTAGTSYTARGWVRSITPGKKVCLRIREWSPSGVVGGSSPACVTATTEWQPFAPQSYSAAASGNELEVYAYGVSAASGDSFDIDGVALDDGSLDPVPPEPGGDPNLLAVADVASCWSSGDEATARLLDSMAGTIAIAGDTEQNKGSEEEFEGCYEATWGRHKWRTRPAVGDHEYRTAGAAGYWAYFGAAAGPSGKGWYSYDLGAWHIVVLNSNCNAVGGCGPGSEQYEWLRSDLASRATTCTAAYFHHPRWSSGGVHGSISRVQPFWDLLYDYSAEFVVGGNDHNYQRFAQQDPSGAADPGRGIRQFVVGTGGTQHYALGSPIANLEVANDDAFGVLDLTLRPSAYEWEFVPQAGKSFRDSGSTPCSRLP